VSLFSTQFDFLCTRVAQRSVRCHCLSIAPYTYACGRSPYCRPPYLSRCTWEGSPRQRSRRCGRQHTSAFASAVAPSHTRARLYGFFASATLYMHKSLTDFVTFPLSPLSSVHAVLKISHTLSTGGSASADWPVGVCLSLFHRRTRASYVYNVCLAWYNVLLTPRIHSSLKFVGLPLATRAMVE